MRIRRLLRRVLLHVHIQPVISGLQSGQEGAFMRHVVLAVLVSALMGTAFGQGRGTYNSLGGFGSVLYPGTGHAPGVTPPPLFPTRLGNTVAGRPFGGSPNHPNGHNRTAIVPYPVFYGGYAGSGYGYDTQQPQPDQGGGPPIVNTNTAPSVVINQNFIPDRSNPVVRDYGPPQPSSDAGQPQSSGMQMYEAPTHPYADAQAQQAGPQRRAPVANDEQPTLYLIAFKDHSIVQALGYWMEGNTLHYVSIEHSLNQASLDLIDRQLSQRLNDERGVEFKLPQAR